MDFISGIGHNRVFQVAFVSWFIAQLLKVILTLFTERKLILYRMVGSGGMPSSHSSTVMGLTTAIGLMNGFDSLIFGMSLIFSLVVMYDASGVRRSVGKQAIILNTILEDLYEHKPIGNVRLKELVGHTPVEVLAGAALGILIANLMIK